MTRTTRLSSAAMLLAVALLALAAFLLTRPGVHSSASAASATPQIATLASSAAPAVPASLRADVASAVGSATRGGTADIANARQVLTSNSGLKLLAVPAGDSVCADAVLPGSLGQQALHCVPNAEFNTGGAWQMVGAPPSVDVVGLVPDGVTSVTVTFVDGSSKSATVANNAFDVRSEVASASISFATPAGAYSSPAESAGK